MDSATLVALEVETGSRVLAALDEAGLDVRVALWLVTPEYEEPRIVLASSAFDHVDRLKAYEKVVNALRGHFVSVLPAILILKMKDPFIRGLRDVFSEAADVSGMRLGQQRIGGRYVTDAFVYRIR